MVQPTRFGQINGAPVCVARCGTTEAVNNQRISNFSFGNLSNDSRQNGSQNGNIVNAASDPNIRAEVQSVV